MLRTHYLIIFEVLLLILGAGSLIYVKMSSEKKGRRKEDVSFMEGVILTVTTVLFVINLVMDLFVPGAILPKLLLIDIAGIAVGVIAVVVYKNKNTTGDIAEKDIQEVKEDVVESEKSDEIKETESKEEIEAKENIKIVEEIMSITEDVTEEKSEEDLKEETESEKVEDNRDAVKKAAQLKAAKIAAAKKIQKEKSEKQKSSEIAE